MPIVCYIRSVDPTPFYTNADKAVCYSKLKLCYLMLSSYVIIFSSFNLDDILYVIFGEKTKRSVYKPKLGTS